MIDAAFKAGMVDAWSFWDMTPKEVNGRLTAHAAKVQRGAEDADRLAWMVGYYCAMGYHAPKDYPGKPSIIEHSFTQEEPEEEDNMKAKLTAYAEIHNAIEVNNIDA